MNREKRLKAHSLRVNAALSKVKPATATTGQPSQKNIVAPTLPQFNSSANSTDEPAAKKMKMENKPAVGVQQPVVQKQPAPSQLPQHTAQQPNQRYGQPPVATMSSNTGTSVPMSYGGNNNARVPPANPAAMSTQQQRVNAVPSGMPPTGMPPLPKMPMPSSQNVQTIPQRSIHTTATLSSTRPTIPAQVQNSVQPRGGVNHGLIGGTMGGMRPGNNLPNNLANRGSIPKAPPKAAAPSSLLDVDEFDDA